MIYWGFNLFNRGLLFEFEQEFSEMQMKLLYTLLYSLLAKFSPNNFNVKQPRVKIESIINHNMDKIKLKYWNFSQVKTVTLNTIKMIFFTLLIFSSQTSDFLRRLMSLAGIWLVSRSAVVVWDCRHLGDCGGHAKISSVYDRTPFMA